MKKILIIVSLIGATMFPPTAMAYSDNRVTQYYVPVVKVQSFSAPDYTYACIDPTDKSTCYYKRNYWLSEKSVEHSSVYSLDKNGKTIKTDVKKDKIIIRPLYLNTNGKPMTEDEINRIKKLSEAKHLEEQKREEERAKDMSKNMF